MTSLNLGRGVVLYSHAGAPVPLDARNFQELGHIEPGEAFITPGGWESMSARFSDMTRTVTASFRVTGEQAEVLRRIMLWPNPLLGIPSGRSPRSLRRRRAKLRRKRTARRKMHRR